MSKTTLIITIFILGGIGQLVVNWAFSRLQSLARNDSTNKMAKQLPQKTLFNGHVYEKGQSYKFYPIILNSKNWPKNETLRSQLQTIRIITLVGMGFFVLSVSAFALLFLGL